MDQTILIVDDNETHSCMLVTTLRSAGFNVIPAQTANEALGFASLYRPHAVVLKINLPDMNGFEVCFRIKGEPKTSHIPVIFYSAMNPISAARRHAESVGGAAFLTHPMDADHLLAVLRGLLLKNEVGL